MFMRGERARRRAHRLHQKVSLPEPLLSNFSQRADFWGSSMHKTRTLVSLTLGLLLSTAAIDGAAAGSRLVIPHPTVPSGQAYSPHAVVAKLAQSRFKVMELCRKGQAYAIVAIGPTGNKVQMTVDGASGAIVGMAILRRAHSAARPNAHRPPAGHAPPPAHTPPPATHTASNPPPRPAAP